ncbi:MAG: succinate dehydrogenase, cytochrome b556 subunit [Caldimonas sp.]
MARTGRPVFLDPRHISMPVGAMASIGHRISGVVLAVGVPVAVYLLAMSLRDERSYATVLGLFRHLAFKAALVVLVWAFAHHVLAGVRHLLSDFDIGSRLRSARRSAWLVNTGSTILALLAAVVLL